MDYGSPLCAAIASDNVNIYHDGDVSGLGICTTNDEWLDFFHDMGVLKTKADKSEILTTDRINLNRKDIDNSMLPSSSMGVSELESIYFTNNNLTNVDFLSDLMNIRSNSASYKLDLENNKLNNINGLSKLEEAGQVNLRGAENSFKDLSPLRGFTKGSILLEEDLDYYDQFTTKFSIDNDPICNAIIKNDVAISFKPGSSYNKYGLCNTNDPVIDFLLAKSQSTLTVTKQEEIPTNYIMRLNGKNLLDSDIPPANLWKLDNIHTILLFDNDITNVDFLSSFTKTSGTSATSNLVDLLDNDNLTDISGLSNITEVGKIDLERTAVTDLSALKNLTNFTLYLNRDLDNFKQFTEKLNITDSPICEGIVAGNVNISFGASTSYNKYDLCDYNDPVISFLFSKNRTAIRTYVQEDLPTNTSIKINGMNLVDSDIPSDNLWRIDNIHSVFINDNDLTNVDFLSSMTKTSSSSSGSNIIDLSGNENLSNISGLSNLIEVGRVDLTETAVNDLSSLEGLTKGQILINKSNGADFAQYSDNWDYTKAICSNVLSGRVTIVTKDAGSLGGFDFCSTADEWLNLFHKNGKYRSYSTNSSDVPVGEQINLSLNLVAKGYDSEDLPNTGFPFSEIKNLNMRGNNFTNLDFLSGLTKIYTGTNASYKLDVSANNLTDITGLSSLKTGVIDLRTNADLNDLSGLENLETGIIYLTDKTVSDLIQSTDKFDMSTPFCQNMSERTGSVKIIFSGNYYPQTNELCE